MHATRARLCELFVSELEKRLKQEFINDILKIGRKEGKNVKYVRQISRKELEEDYEFCVPAMDAKLTGREILVEYHLFTKMDSAPWVQQRRGVP